MSMGCNISAGFKTIKNFCKAIGDIGIGILILGCISQEDDIELGNICSTLAAPFILSGIKKIGLDSLFMPIEEANFEYNFTGNYYDIEYGA